MVVSISLLALFSLGPTLADSEQDVLLGSWVSQGERGEEFELTIHPDGTFHMVVTVVEDVLAEEDYDEEYDDEEDELGWDEFMDEVDSNDNGVLDEGDFEAARERGEENLPPSWDDVLNEFGDTNGDNVIDQEEYEFGRYEAIELTGFLTDLFGEEMVSTISIKGTWESADDQFALTPLEVVYEFNGLSLVEYYTLFIEGMFDLMVQESEMNSEEPMSEEEWLQFMLFVFSMPNLGWDEFIGEVDRNDNGVWDEEDFEAARESGEEYLPSSWDEVLAEFGDMNGDNVIDQEEYESVDVPESASLEELKELVVGQMVLMFERLVDKPPIVELENFVFSLDRNEMTATDSYGETLVYVRVENARSVVETSSWGQIKALHR